MVCWLHDTAPAWMLMREAATSALVPPAFPMVECARVVRNSGIVRLRIGAPGDRAASHPAGDTEGRESAISAGSGGGRRPGGLPSCYRRGTGRAWTWPTLMYPLSNAARAQSVLRYSYVAFRGRGCTRSPQRGRGCTWATACTVSRNALNSTASAYMMQYDAYVASALK